jgi:hypothetical protein
MEVDDHLAAVDEVVGIMLTGSAASLLGARAIWACAALSRPRYLNFARRSPKKPPRKISDTKATLRSAELSRMTEKMNAEDVITEIEAFLSVIRKVLCELPVQTAPHNAEVRQRLQAEIVDLLA